MKKLLIYTLLFTHLFTGWVFASDIHSEALSVHDSSVYEVVLHAHELSSFSGEHYAEHSYDEHHCHGSAHLAGLIYSQTRVFSPFTDCHVGVCVQTPVYMPASPLLRPPIVI